MLFSTNNLLQTLNELDKDYVLLIAGAILGFITKLILEFFSNRLSVKHSSHLAELDDLNKKIDKLSRFIEGGISIAQNNLPPLAWVQVLEISKPRIMFKLGINMDNDSTEIGNDDSIEPAKPEKFLLTSSQTMGRHSQCDICVRDTTISRFHAVIRFEQNQYRIYDLGSKSGTYVNNKEVTENGSTLLNNNIIAFGGAKLRFGRTHESLYKELICPVHGPYHEKYGSCPFCSGALVPPVPIEQKTKNISANKEEEVACPVHGPYPKKYGDCPFCSGATQPPVSTDKKTKNISTDDVKEEEVCPVHGPYDKKYGNCPFCFGATLPPISTDKKTQNLSLLCAVHGTYPASYGECPECSSTLTDKSQSTEV